MRKVMVFGTFDLFHKGHESFLRQAKELGNFLVVVIARDTTVSEVKKRKTENDEQKRLSAVQQSGLAEEVVLGELEDKYAVIEKYRPDVIGLGYDQSFFIDDLRRKLDEFGMEKTEIVRLEPFEPEKYKSSKLRRK